MKYQLVIQLVAESLEDFDNLIALEETMRTKLELSSNTLVDGHDFGLGEFNIFIHTDEPHAVLEEVGEIIQETHPGLPFAAGYRDFNDDEYVVLWPLSLQSFRVA